MSMVLRSAAKRILPPFARTTAKKVWESYKFSADRKAFLRQNPDAKFVLFSKEQLKEFRERGFYGQIAQDYILSLLFEHDDGVFVDIGANLPVAISNTYFFEKKGWSGFAFDPMKSVKDAWQARSNTKFVNAGISDKVETRQFVEIKPKAGWEHALSGFKEYVRAEDLRDYDHVTYEVECGPVHHFIDPATQVDFVSIDVEGAEALILRGFDFSKSPPKAIVLENNQVLGGEQVHRETLFAHGYRLLARINASDDLFVHSSLAVPAQFRAALDRFG